MTERAIWASHAMTDARLLLPITHSFDDGLFGPKMDFAIKAKRANVAGLALPSDHFPSAFYVKEDADTDYSSLPDLFFAGAYWVVSDAVAQVIRRFDLGNSGLYPANVFRKDRSTPIGEEWFCLNFGNLKTAFLAGESKEVYPLGSGKSGLWRVLGRPKDNALAIGNSALDGPSLWIDASLAEVFFVHGDVFRALKSAGLTRTFGFSKCRVI